MLTVAVLFIVPAGFQNGGLADIMGKFDVYCLGSRRLLVGRIKAGSLADGQEVVFVLIDGYQIVGGGIVQVAPAVSQETGLNRFSRDRQGDRKSNIYPEDSNIGKDQRRKKNKHHSFTVWLTGLSGAGKSTLARGLEERLFHEGIQTYVLDGDNVRSGLNQDLGFSAADRRENIRRVGEVAKLFVNAGIIVVTAFISPYREDRRRVREIMESGEFVEVFVKCSLATCEQRDTKGLYSKSRQSIIRQFTGIDDVYEEPEQPEIVVDTESLTVEESVEQIYRYLVDEYRDMNR